MGALRRAAAAAVIAAVPVVMSIGTAFAGVGMTVAPGFPASVTVGQTGIPATLQVTNTSTAPESGGVMTLTTINLVPACGTTSFVGAGDCPTASADPGVFSVSVTGTGEAGTACAGITFSIGVIDASTGQVTFTPSGGSVVLGSPGSASAKCTIDFSLNSQNEPTHPTTTVNANTRQTAQIGYAAGTASVSSTSGSGGGTSLTNVVKTAPGLSTTATPSAPLGSPISDKATLSAGASPTGAITFTLFGPNNTSCTGTPAFTSTVPVSGSGSYQSAAFTPAAGGAYRWVAAYGGDANNAAVTVACGAANETSTITAASADLSISIGAAPDQLTSGSQLTYTVTVKNYGPSVATTVKVADVLPPSARFVSASATGWTCTLPAANQTGTLTCAFNGSIANAGVASFTLVVKIVAAAPATVLDTATVKGAVPDTDTDNNTATIATDVR